MHKKNFRAERLSKLRRPLEHLRQGGVTGTRAYSPVFRWLANAGIIIRPFHYWSFLGLCIFGFALFTALFGSAVLLTADFSYPPRFVRALVRLGPNFFFGVMLALGFSFAVIHTNEARRIGLPQWRDL